MDGFFVGDARAETRFQREAWIRVRNTERYYARQLRKVSEQIRHIVQAFGTESPQAIAEMQATLHRYADILKPWSRAVARRMLHETARRDDKAWRAHARMLGEEISKELNSADIGGAYQSLLSQQVDLITSIPREAAIRVQQLATEHLYEGRRFPEISAEIMRSGQVSKAKADLIARTETGRAAVTFQQARAEAIGSTHFRWVAVMDYKTRPELGIKNFARLNTLAMGSHRKLHNQIFRWDDPPIAGTRGERALPGAIYNCFTGDTLVENLGDQADVIRALYDGDIVRIVMDDAAFDVTPNHRIATSRGMIPAQFINSGDELLSIDSHSFDSVDNDINSKQTFQEIFEAFSSSRKTPGLGSVVNLYGDITHNDIEIVRAEQNLPFYRTDLFQQICDNMISAADSRILGSRVGGFPTQVFQPFDSRCDEIGSIFLVRPIVVDELVGIDDVPWCDIIHFENSFDSQRRSLKSSAQFDDAPADLVQSNYLLLWKSNDGRFVPARRSNVSFCYSRAGFGFEPPLLQPFTNSIVADIEAPGDLSERKAVLGQTFRVIDKSVRNYSGHVYTASTGSSYYTVTRNRIITTNCRCYAEPVLPRTY